MLFSIVSLSVLPILSLNLSEVLDSILLLFAALRISFVPFSFFDFQKKSGVKNLFSETRNESVH